MTWGSTESAWSPHRNIFVTKIFRAESRQGKGPCSPGRWLGLWGPGWAMGMWLFPLLRISDLGQRGLRRRDLE